MKRSAYALTMDTNRFLLRGGVLTDAHKAKIVRLLLAEKYKPGARIHESKTGPSYPRFFIPPYNDGKKFQTLVPMSPKSYIIADNAYEFEILRLLKLFAPRESAMAQDNHAQMLDEMYTVTQNRLKQTCFGYKRCHYADCFEAGLTVLRFLTFAEPKNTRWMTKQIDVFNGHFADRKRHSGVLRYYWLCLSDMPEALAIPQIERQRDAILEQLGRSYLVKTGDEDIPLLVARNTLARLPAYADLRTRKPYVDERSGRMYFA